MCCAFCFLANTFFVLIVFFYFSNLPKQLKYKITAGLEANILISQTIESTLEKMSRV
ncbi:hypothetical protein CHUAL_013960, partial [Chamberlinius hualienensis]